MSKSPTWFNYGGGQHGQAIRHGSFWWWWYSYGRSGLFRSADLNAVGWLAVLGPGVVLGIVVAFLTEWTWWLTAPVGGLASWLVALVIDARAWRRITTGLGVSDLSRAQAEAVVERLRSQGVEVTLEEEVDAESGEVWLSFQSTNRFLKTIQREIDAVTRRVEG